MTDEEPVNWYRFLEMGSKLLLLLYGFAIVMFSLSLWFIGGKILYSDWMPAVRARAGERTVATRRQAA
jgi:hypothetical protein